MRLIMEVGIAVWDLIGGDQCHIIQRIKIFATQ